MDGWEIVWIDESDVTVKVTFSSVNQYEEERPLVFYCLSKVMIGLWIDLLYQWFLTLLEVLNQKV